MTTAPRPSLADRLYRALLRLYPSEFRGDFGDEMAGVFRQQRRDQRVERGLLGVSWLWLRTIGSIVLRAPREQGETFAADLRYAVRTMRHHAVSSATIVCLLAIGAGANIAVFGLADPLVLRPLPVAAARRLVRVTDANPSATPLFSYPAFLEMRGGSGSGPFEAIAAHAFTTVALGPADSPTSIDGEVVSGNYFHVFAIRPRLGRLLAPADDGALGVSPVVVIAEGLWRDQFGADPAIIGRSIALNGFPFEVIGVAPASFTGSYAFTSRFWAPLAMYRQARPQNARREDKGWDWLFVTARLRAEASLADANAALAQMASVLDRDKPRDEKGTQLRAIPASGLPEGPRRMAATVLAFAASIVVLVLVVTCANIAGVLQGRALTHRHDLAVRHALGASRFRLVRQGLTESLIVATLGAAAGLLVARWLLAAVLGIFRTSMPFEFEQTSAHDARVIVFTAGLAVVTALLFGLLPALRAAGRGEATLREMSPTTTGGRHAARGTRLLVAMQVAICLALLVTAGLLTRSLQNVRALDPGFPWKGLVLARLDTRLRGYDRARTMAYYKALDARLRAVDGVLGVSVASMVPLGGDRARRGFLIPGHRSPEGDPMIRIDYSVVGSQYFETMGIPIVRGRGVTRDDTSASRGVAVINETMARQFWPGGDPIGQRISIAFAKGGPLEIVGVVRDVKYYALEEGPRPYVYLSAEQADGGGGMTLHVRVAATSESLASTLRREAAAIDPLVILRQVVTFEELRQQPLAMRTAMTLIATLFGAIALLLTIVGIYGTMTSAVGQRTREIGVRMAFGAGVSDVFRLIVRDGFLPVAGGLALGLAAAAALTRLIAGQLFGVSVLDPLTYTAAIAAVAVTAVVALSLPARWATRVDPVAVLRAE